MNKEKMFAQQLLDFLYDNPSPYHVVDGGKRLLEEKGFVELELTEQWHVEQGGKYFVSRNDSTLIAFIVGNANPEEHGFRIVGAHTDAPALRIKTRAEMCAEKAYLKLNIETYGGLIFSTWLDRPLGIAGRVCAKSDNALRPRVELININKPIAIIPNIAKHLNRELNDGYKYNPQKDLLPLMGLADADAKPEGWFMKMLAEESGIAEEDILGFDLYLYDYQKGTFAGMNEEFISVGRLDDVAMSHAALHAIAQSEAGPATIVAACFDNEEVGSRTKQGAASALLSTILERIMLALGKNTEQYYRARYNSFFLSCDMAHAVHPNGADRHDPTHRPVINKGPVLKVHHGQKYTTDADSAAVFKTICQKAGVPMQEFHNRSDARGGGTIGPIVSIQLECRGVDIGNPMLSMHSIRELGGVKDNYSILKCFKTFFSI